MLAVQLLAVRLLAVQLLLVVTTEGLLPSATVLLRRR
jgi:hypothetical protein